MSFPTNNQNAAAAPVPPSSFKSRKGVKQPTVNEKLVKCLMDFVGTCKKPKLNKKDKTTKDVVYLKFKCNGKNGNCKFETEFENGQGWSNPLSHLKACYGNKLIEETLTSLKANEGSHFLDGFVRERYTEREQAVHAWIQLVVFEYLPLACVEKDIYRNFQRYKSEGHVSAKYIRALLLMLVEIVKLKIANVLPSDIALVFDGWSRNSVHYVAVFATFMKKTTVVKKKSKTVEEYAAKALLVVSPMAALPVDDNAEALEAAKATPMFLPEILASDFNAEVHVNFILETLTQYGKTIEENIVCFTSDNCSVNKKVGRLMKKPMIGCKNHLFQLEVEKTIKQNPDLCVTLDAVQDTMRSAKCLKNSAMLRNITDLRPKVANDTRWSGKYEVLERFMRLRAGMWEIASTQRPGHLAEKFPSMHFQGMLLDRQVQDQVFPGYLTMLRTLDSFTRHLQTEMLKLCDCRNALDTVLELANGDLKGFGIGQGYIGTTSVHVTSPDFENAVIKIQSKDNSKVLTQLEQRAVRHLLVRQDTAVGPSLPYYSTNDDGAGAGAGAGGGGCASAARVAESVLYTSECKKRRNSSEVAKELIKKMKATSDDASNWRCYKNLDYIIGSAAVVERLWSIAKLFMTDRRKGLSSDVFEALLYLNANNDYWGIADVQKAMVMLKDAPPSCQASTGAGGGGQKGDQNEEDGDGEEDDYEGEEDGDNDEAHEGDDDDEVEIVEQEV